MFEIHLSSRADWVDWKWANADMTPWRSLGGWQMTVLERQRKSLIDCCMQISTVHSKDSVSICNQIFQDECDSDWIWPNSAYLERSISSQFSQNWLRICRKYLRPSLAGWISRFIVDSDIAYELMLLIRLFFWMLDPSRSIQIPFIWQEVNQLLKASPKSERGMVRARDGGTSVVTAKPTVVELSRIVANLG